MLSYRVTLFLAEGPEEKELVGLYLDMWKNKILEGSGLIPCENNGIWIEEYKDQKFIGNYTYYGVAGIREKLDKIKSIREGKLESILAA